MRAQKRANLGELVLAIDERGRRRRGGCLGACSRNGRDRGVVREDGLFKSPQVRTRFEGQLLREHASRLAEGLEGVGLAAAPVEREHQLPPQPLTERVLVDRHPKCGYDLAMLAERERRLELLFQRINPKRLEPPRLGAEPVRVDEPVQRRTAPGIQREPNGLGRCTGIARAQCTTRLSEQLLEP